jgi:hypothetical protein
MGDIEAYPSIIDVVGGRYQALDDDRRKANSDRPFLEIEFQAWKFPSRPMPQTTWTSLATKNSVKPGCASRYGA